MSNSAIIPYGDGQAGVTLVEVLAALVVVALTLVTAASGLNLLARSGDRGAAVVSRHDMFSRGIAVLRRDIEQLERVVWKRGQDVEFAFHGEAAYLAFVVIEPPFPSEAGPYFIAYSIQRGADGDTLTRGRAPFDYPATDMRRLPTEDLVNVLEGHYRFRFAYLDRKGGRERWLPQWDDARRIPDLVRVEVTSLEGGKPVQPIVFRPKVDAERACASEDGTACTIGSEGALAPGSQ
jgi:hypothetical protein